MKSYQILSNRIKLYDPWPSLNWFLCPVVWVSLGLWMTMGLYRWILNVWSPGGRGTQQLPYIKYHTRSYKIIRKARICMKLKRLIQSLFRMMQIDIDWCSMMQYDAVQYDTVWYSVSVGMTSTEISRGLTRFWLNIDTNTCRYNRLQ